MKEAPSGVILLKRKLSKKQRENLKQAWSDLATHRYGGEVTILRKSGIKQKPNKKDES